jgi:hypothetical protein
VDKKLDQIDYHSLAERNKVAWRAVLHSAIFKLVVVAAIPSLLAVGYLKTLYRGNSATGIVEVVQFLLPFLFLGVGYLYSLYQKTIHAAWRSFAVDNGWNFIEGNAAKSLLPKSLHTYRRAYDYRIATVQAVIDGTAWNVQTYRFTVGIGKDRETKCYTILSTALQKPLPYMVLDARRSLSAIERIPVGAKKVILEGNFSRYFDVWIEEGSHIDVLSILTPDVMQSILRNNVEQDIEIDGTMLYLVQPGISYDPTFLHTIIFSAQQFNHEIAHRVRTLRYDASANKNYVLTEDNQTTFAAPRTFNNHFSPQLLALATFITFAVLVVCVLVAR